MSADPSRDRCGPGMLSTMVVRSTTSQAPTRTTQTTQASAASSAPPPAPTTTAGTRDAFDGKAPATTTKGLPAELVRDIAALSPATQHDLRALFAAVDQRKDRAAVLRDIVDALADPTLWPMKPTQNDERRIVAMAVARVPLPERAARGPMPVTTFIDALTNGKDAVPGARAALEAAWHGGGDVVMAPEWFFVPEHGVALSAREKDTLVDALRALTRGDDRLLIPGTIPWRDDEGGYHNTAFAISDGRVLHSVDKRGDGDDGDIAKSAGLTHVAEEGGCVFSWRGLDVGLEVCRDHGDARLRIELLDRARHPRGVVDLQLVVSSGVWLKHAAVGDGGVVAVAQGDGIAGHEHATRHGERLDVDALSA